MLGLFAGLIGIVYTEIINILVGDKSFKASSTTLCLPAFVTSEPCQVISINPNETEMFFDRDPGVFNLVLKHIRGYNIKQDLFNLSPTQVQQLHDDAVYYGYGTLADKALNSLWSRFDNSLNPSYYIRLTNNDREAYRENWYASTHVSSPLIGTLYTGTRYAEFMVTSNNQNHMFGVTEAEGYNFEPYPGHSSVSGISYHCVNQHLYRLGGAESTSSADCAQGDTIGILVYISNDKYVARVKFYHNKVLVRDLDLKTYLNVNKGVKFVANMHGADCATRVVDSPEYP